MLITTTPTFEGKRILEYKGVVVGQAILAAHHVRDLFAGIREAVGGRSQSYENSLREARDIAMNEMSEEAERLGGNAVVGMDLDYAGVGEHGAMIMVSASGTAVVLDL